MLLPSYLVVDIENDSSNRYGCKAGNFLYDPIVAIACKNQQELWSDYIYPAKLHKLVIDEEILVGHNIVHDLLFLWHLPSIQDFLKFGGKIWDTAVVEYILTGQQHKYPALRDIAVNKYGCPERTKHIEEYFKQGLKVSEMPWQDVIQDVESDVLDTEQIFLKQYTLCQARGIIPLVEAEMTALLATTEMRYNGMKIDLDTLKINKNKAQEELDILMKELDELCAKYWNCT